jgi:exodeoxyribonuclease VII large subunit
VKNLKLKICLLMNFLDNLQPLTVTQYQARVNGLLGEEVVFVEGEVSNFREIPGRNFCYFDIKDSQAVAKCFQLFFQARKVALQNGSQVQVLGQPKLQKNGSLVIQVQEVLLRGEGALRERYLQLKAQLEAEGLFAEEHKQALPGFPERISLICGKNSSAYHDVIAELGERWGGKVTVVPARVQGAYAKKEVMAALRYLNQQADPDLRVEVIILARGGGSLEELQAFDSEEVVREVFASRIPVISAIGHEDHWTLCDFVADRRAKTPTKAAQLAVPDRQELQEWLEGAERQAQRSFRLKLEQRTGQLQAYQEELLRIIQSRLEKVSGDLAQAQQRIQQAAQRRLNQAAERLVNWQRNLQLLNPEAILARGYASVEKSGIRIRQASQLKPKDRVEVRLARGEFSSIVDEVSP